MSDMQQGKLVTKHGVECPNCGYLDRVKKEHYASCDNCKTEYECPQNADPLGSAVFDGSVTELDGLKECMERGFRALHLEVAPQVCNDLRNTVYVVINHLEGNE